LHPLRRLQSGERKGGAADASPSGKARTDSGYHQPSGGRVTVIKQDQLPWSAIAHELVGADHGLEI